LKKYLKKVILRRFIEYTGVCVLISAVSTYLYTKGVIPATQRGCLLALTAGTVLYCIIHFFMLRECFFDLRNRKEFYTANYVAYFLFMLTGVLILFVFGKDLHTWLFSITKFLKYSNYQFSTIISTAFFHLLTIFVIAVSPVGMWRLRRER